MTRHVVEGLAVARRRPDGAPATVLFVHGAMDRAASFGRVMRRLEDLDVIAYDRRGYAGSLAGGIARGIDGLLADLAVVAAWAQPERLVVVGHSMGGLVALDSYRGLAATPSAIGSYETPTPWTETTPAATGESTIAMGKRDGAAAAAEHFYRAMVGDRIWDRLRERDRAERRAEGPALLADLEAARQPAVAPDPAEVGSVVHIARGTSSSEHLRAAAQRMADRFDTDCEEIAGAGHGAHLSHPDEFARWVRAMI